jgi:hypothetical protein
MFAPPIIEFMLRASLLLCCLLPSAGCYKHVVRTSGDPSMPRQTYDPNVDDTQPGFFDQLFWGDPPAGQDPVDPVTRRGPESGHRLRHPQGRPHHGH